FSKGCAERRDPFSFRRVGQRDCALTAWLQKISGRHSGAHLAGGANPRVVAFLAQRATGTAPDGGMKGAILFGRADRAVGIGSRDEFIFACLKQVPDETEN